MIEPWPRRIAARLIEASREAGAPGRVGPPPRLPGDPRRAIRLPPPAGGDGAIVDVVRRRRSGGIVDAPIPAGALAALLEAADAVRPIGGGPGPILFPLAFRAEGLAAGVYRHDPAGLVPIRPADRDVVRDGVLLQIEHGRAAAILFVVAPLAARIDERGERGYRTAALDAGRVLDRLCLAAAGLGLSHTISLSFVLTRAEALLGVDGVDLSPLAAFVVGGPAGVREDTGKG